MLEALGTTLRAAREEADVSLRDVSIAADIVESSLSRLERGQITDAPRKLPQIMAGYAQATGIPVADLMRLWVARLAEDEAREALTAARRAEARRRRRASRGAAS